MKFEGPHMTHQKKGSAFFLSKWNSSFFQIVIQHNSPRYFYRIWGFCTIFWVFVIGCFEASAKAHLWCVRPCDDTAAKPTGKKRGTRKCCMGGVIAFLEGDFRKSIFFWIFWLFFHNPKREFKNKKWGIPTWSCNPRICAVFRAQSGPRGHCRPWGPMGTSTVFLFFWGGRKNNEKTRMALESVWNLLALMIDWLWMF